MRPNIWVVIPAFNEERLIGSCLDSLARQTDLDFKLVVVDNASTDRTAYIVERWLDEHRHIQGRVISESQKGTGAAADTGFRLAISMGADWVARTDADCLVDSGWVAAARRNTSRAKMLGGKTRTRTDDHPPRPVERLHIPVTVLAARMFGKIRPTNRGPEYLCPYVMCVGNNLAVEAGTYLASGGFPRLAIEDLPVPNDRALVNRVRRISSLVRYCPEMIVYNSVRRLRAYGLRRTLRWYADHSLDTGRFEVDIR